MLPYRSHLRHISGVRLSHMRLKRKGNKINASGSWTNKYWIQTTNWPITLHLNFLRNDYYCKQKLITFPLDRWNGRCLKRDRYTMSMVERSGKLLCHQLKQTAVQKAIPEIWVSSDCTFLHPQTINDHYHSLQEIHHAISSSLLIDLFKSNDMLDAPIVAEENNTDNKIYANQKDPGSWCIAIEFYKAFISKLAPFLCLLFQKIPSDGNLPLTMTQATISVLLKKGRDPLDCGSYRPISLLCCVQDSHKSSTTALRNSATKTYWPWSNRVYTREAFVL